MDEQVSNNLYLYMREYLKQCPQGHIFTKPFETYLLSEAEKNDHQTIVLLVESLKRNEEQKMNGGHIVSMRNFTIIEYGETNREPINGPPKITHPPYRQLLKPAIQGMKKNFEEQNDVIPRNHVRQPNDGPNNVESSNSVSEARKRRKKGNQSDEIKPMEIPQPKKRIYKRR